MIRVIVAVPLVVWTLSAPAQIEEIDPLYDETGEPSAEQGDFVPDGGVDSDFDDDIESYQLDAEPEDLGYSIEGGAEQKGELTTKDQGEDQDKADPLSDPSAFDRDLPDYANTTTEFSLDAHRMGEPRSYWWPPLISLIAPGFGQWYDGQYTWAAAYSGAAAGGLIYAGLNSVDEQGVSELDEEFYNRRMYGNKERKYLLGAQVYQMAGGLSAYHSFRTAVRTRQEQGQFLFLRKEERIADILTAPFEFSFLSRPSTYIPLGIGAALYLLVTEYSDKVDDDLQRRSLNEADAFFASAYSYNAGTHEEAVFRGWVQPMFFHLTSGQSIWSNVITSGIFAAAHLPTNSMPLPQFALSLHLGWVTERNSWTIAESVFIHTWWDVLAFLGQYQVKMREGAGSKVEPALHLPPIEIHF